MTEEKIVRGMTLNFKTKVMQKFRLIKWTVLKNFEMTFNKFLFPQNMA